jgi:uncharacterized membrane protein
VKIPLLSSPEEAASLRADLRDGTGPFLRRRRAIAALSLFNVASMGLVTLYQMGLLRHVPEPRLPGLDGDKVNGSLQAYSLLGTPDAALAVGSYAATLGLAAVGGAERSETMPWAPVALAAKASFDAAAAAKLLANQPTRYRAFCAWCVLSACATFAILPLALPEAKEAWRRIRR